MIWKGNIAVVTFGGKSVFYLIGAIDEPDTHTLVIDPIKYQFNSMNVKKLKTYKVIHRRRIQIL